MQTESSDYRGKVLFVDDEENILRALRRLFADEELEIFVANSGAAGLEVLKTSPDIGLIVSDQKMPGMSGVEFLARTREIAPGAMRILLTGYADIDAAINAINVGGAYRYISKPWQDEELVRTVKEALERHFLVQENKRLNQIVQRQNEELKKWNSELEIMVQEQTIELQKSYDQLKKMREREQADFRSMIVTFSGLLELRDKRMLSHARNVAELAGAAARQLDISPEERESLLVASLLHDIGKIGMPDILLQIPYNDMSEEEKTEYRQHPVRGHAALAGIEGLQKAGQLIRHHHELFNGTGFPDGLKGDEIPLAGQLLAIADHLDNCSRTLAGPDDILRLLEEIETEAREKKLNPKLVPLFKKPAKLLYGKLLEQSESLELEIHPKNLRGGMVLSRNVCSGTGILLLSKGTVLQSSSIQLLQRYYKLDPAKRGIFVYTKKQD